MNRFKIGTAYILIIFFFFSCKEQNCVKETVAKIKGKTVKRKINKCDKGNLIYEQEFATDSLGGLIADGYSKDFYDNQKLKSLSFYKKGKQDSIAVEYYESGAVKESKYVSEGHLFGPQNHFSENGSFEFINFYTMSGENWLAINFDDKGRVSGIKGRLLHITLSDKCPNIDSLSLQSTLFMINEVPVIQNMETILNIKIKKEGITLYDKTISDFTPFYNINVYGFKYNFQSKGDYEYLPTVSLINKSDGKIISTDSVSHRVKVY